MSEQDAAETGDDGQESPDNRDEDGPTSKAEGESGDAGASDGDDSVSRKTTDADADSAAATVEEIASEPDDPEATLAEIIDKADWSDAETEPDVEGPVPDPGDVEPDEALVERVREASPETTAKGIALLRRRVEALESQLVSREEEVEDLESRLRRKQADFQNYKKRQQERMEEEKRRATEDLVERLVDVRDNLARALQQDEDAEIRGGVETTLKQFDEQLRRENVERIEPEPGDEVDPNRHEALATIAADQPEDTVAEVHRPGYVMAGKVVRPAQVAVSDGSGRAQPVDEDDAGDSSGTSVPADSDEAAGGEDE